jgi:hypothetical protein
MVALTLMGSERVKSHLNRAFLFGFVRRSRVLIRAGALESPELADFRQSGFGEKLRTACRSATDLDANSRKIDLRVASRVVLLIFVMARTELPF